MKKLTNLLFCCLLMGSLSAKTWYVAPNGQGDGQSWSDATSDLVQVLSLAEAGDEVWVAKGTFLPTTDNDRNASFHIKDGISLYGGFEGHETSHTERKADAATTLSGAIGTSEMNDNVYSVVTTTNVSSNTIVDGFIIRDGVADAMIHDVSNTSCGGGWFNDGSKGESSPSITNCQFTNNYARKGGAFYNYSQGGICAPTFEQCVFDNNKADFKGGAIFNDGNLGKCDIVATSCRFDNNLANFGAGVYNQATHGEAKSLITDCTFTSNSSRTRGSAIYNDNRDRRSTCEAVVDQCTFEKNYDPVGEEVANAVNNINPNGYSDLSSYGHK